MAYTGESIKDLDITTPLETEVGNVLNDAQWETKKVLKNQFAVVAKVGAYTLTASDSIVNCNGTFTITLPTPSTVASAAFYKEYLIKSIVGGGTVTLGGTVDGTVNPTITAGNSMHIYTDGTSWFGVVLGSFTSAQLLAALTDETGTGVAVFGTSPVFTTQISTPKIVTQAGDIEITPAGNANIVLQGSGSGNVGIGATPNTVTEVNKTFAVGSYQQDFLRLTATQGGGWFSQVGYSSVGMIQATASLGILRKLWVERKIGQIQPVVED